MDAETYAAAGLAAQIPIQILKYFIIVFPCLDLFSAFSLNAIVLVSTMTLELVYPFAQRTFSDQ